jgi:hypothetical protein
VGASAVPNSCCFSSVAGQPADSAAVELRPILASFKSLGHQQLFTFSIPHFAHAFSSPVSSTGVAPHSSVALHGKDYCR